MVAVGEEAGVEHRHLEHGDLQATDQRLDGDRDVRVIENEVEEHGDDINRDRFETADLFGVVRLANEAHLVDDDVPGVGHWRVLHFVERRKQQLIDQRRIERRGRLSATLLG